MVNVLLALALSGLVATMFVPGWGIVVLIGSLFLIYVKGYLIPGTPVLTQRYLPGSLLRRFDGHSAHDPSSTEDVESVLRTATAVEVCEKSDDLRLDPTFREAWWERIATYRCELPNDIEFVTVLDIDPQQFEYRAEDDGFVITVDGMELRRWPSRAAFVADVAAARELNSRYPGWSEMDIERRSAVISGLRAFLDRCPACEGPLRVDPTVVESCCRSVHVITTSCETCGARLLETERPDA